MTRDWQRNSVNNILYGALCEMQTLIKLSTDLRANSRQRDLRKKAVLEPSCDKDATTPVLALGDCQPRRLSRAAGGRHRVCVADQRHRLPV